MELEHCCECDAETGKAGISDGSLYASSDRGPYCESCWDEVPHKLAEECDDKDAEIARLRRRPQTKVIDWSKVGPNVPVKVWDDNVDMDVTVIGKLMEWNNWEHSSLQTGLWVFNSDGKNPWPEGVEVEVWFRGYDKPSKLYRDSGGGDWGILPTCGTDIIASRCVGLAKGWTYE